MSRCADVEPAGATAQTTLVTGVDANANNQALAKQGHEAVFDVVEKKKLEPNHDPKVRRGPACARRCHGASLFFFFSLWSVPQVPKHEKHANYKPDVKRTHTIQQPGASCVISTFSVSLTSVEQATTTSE